VWVPRRDFFGNLVHHFAIQSPHRSLRVTAVSQVLLSAQPADRAQAGSAQAPAPSAPLAGAGIAASPPWEQARDAMRKDLSAPGLEARQFLFDSPLVKISGELREYAAASFAPGRPLLEAAMDLTGRIHRDFRYDPKATVISTPIEQVMAMRGGVCQDFAHLQIGCMRAMGLPARYVSGYLATRADGSARPVGADASHAWLAVFCPGLGWTDIDPTNNQIARDRHITVAWGRDYGDVAPVKGVILGGGQHVIRVEVSVVPVQGRE
jgi:transglutaminase-like putative cysteine protease